MSVMMAMSISKRSERYLSLQIMLWVQKDDALKYISDSERLF
jgi:hypothetical protein